MIDIEATLLDGAHHEVDSSALAFEIAARAAMREAMAGAAPRLLEPVMRVEVMTPQNFMGDVIGDINSRRGQVQGMEPRGPAMTVTAMVPLATMFGYVNALRSITQGRGQFSMFFERYEPAPRMVADDVRAHVA